jgi:hypothetical protein
MNPTDIATFILRYPDGWEESWAVNPAATRESLITCGLQLLDLAGVSYSMRIEGVTLDDLPPHHGIRDDYSDAPESVPSVETPAQPTAEDFSSAEVTAPPAPAPPKKPPPRRDRPKPATEPLPPAA